VFELLERANVALCLHDMAGSRTNKVAIGPFVYVRFHGPARYAGRYDDRVAGYQPSSDCVHQLDR
jgi:hypothetical protein